MYNKIILVGLLVFGSSFAFAEQFTILSDKDHYNTLEVINLKVQVPTDPTFGDKHNVMLYGPEGLINNYEVKPGIHNVEINVQDIFQIEGTYRAEISYGTIGSSVSFEIVSEQLDYVRDIQDNFDIPELEITELFDDLVSFFTTNVYIYVLFALILVIIIIIFLKRRGKSHRNFQRNKSTNYQFNNKSTKSRYKSPMKRRGKRQQTNKFTRQTTSNKSKSDTSGNRQQTNKFTRQTTSNKSKSDTSGNRQHNTNKFTRHKSNRSNVPTKFNERTTKSYNQVSSNEISENIFTDEIPKVENTYNEFKEFFQYDKSIDNSEKSKVESIKRNVQERFAIAVCAFGNAKDGGTIYLGIHSSGKIVGLEKDRKLGNFSNYDDDFANHIRNTLGNFINKQEFLTSKITVTFRKIDENTIAVVRVLPAKTPLYCKSKNGEFFYVRSRIAPRAEKLEGEDQISYIRDRFPNFAR